MWPISITQNKALVVRFISDSKSVQKQSEIDSFIFVDSDDSDNVLFCRFDPFVFIQKKIFTANFQLKIQSHWRELKFILFLFIYLFYCIEAQY